MADAAAQPAAPDVSHADIGIVYATAIEIDPFLKRCERVRSYTEREIVFHGGRFDDIRIAFARSGMGYALARKVTQELVASHSPRWIISTGFAGGLLPEMQVGDIALAQTLIDTHGQECQLDFQMASDPAKRLHVGKFLTVDALVRTAAEKQQLHDQYGAICIDMESLAVAQVCHDTKTRFFAVRAISDDLSHDLPPEILTVVGPTGALRLGAALGALWKRPGSAKDLWNLRERALQVSERLATFLEGVVVQLYEAHH